MSKLCFPPILYDRNIFEHRTKTTFNIKNILKEFKRTLGLNSDHSYIKDDDSCAVEYIYLLDEPFDPSRPDGLRLSEKITIRIQIERTQGQHTLEECPWKREFRKLKDD